MKDELKKPKVIIFDWDNTLADTWGIIHEALHKTFVEMGHEPWTLEDVINGREGIHRSLRESFPNIFGDKWEEAKEHYYRNFLECHLEKIEKISGAEETVKHLSESDIYVVIVSNKTGKYLRKEVEHFGWSEHFSEVIGATDAEEDKPSPQPVIMALEKSGISNINPDDVWFVGDSATDIECALRTNCLPVYFGEKDFPDEFDDDERLDKKIHLKGHDELLELLKGYKVK